MKQVSALSAAESQLLALYTRLEEYQDGLGDRFDRDYCAACVKLSQFPEIGPQYDGRIRRLVMHKWNIGLYYAIEGERIMIHGALDFRQSPENIRKQLGLI